MKKFTLKGVSGVAEVTLEVEGTRAVQDLRKALEKKGVHGAEAERVIDDLLVSGLTRMARHFERIKAKHIDTVVNLRAELDGLYHDIFIGEHAGTQAGLKQAIDSRIGKIQAKYAELDKALAEATLPLEHMKLAAEADDAALAAVKKVEPEALPHADRPLAKDLAREGRGRSRLRRKGFEPFKGGYKVKFADGAETVLSIKNNRYTAEIYPPPGIKGGKPTVISEFQLSRDRYSTDLKTTSILQRNHVFQNSLMEKLFGRFGYDGGTVPTVWLRDSKTGSPHGQVTAQQRGFKTRSGTHIDGAEAAARKMARGDKAAAAPSQLNLAEIQRQGIAQMRSIGCPDEVIAQYMREFNRHFEATVLKDLNSRVASGKMTQAQVDSLLGGWKPGVGIPIP